MDPVKTCTGPKLGKKDLKDEGRRRDQTVDGKAQERAGNQIWGASEEDHLSSTFEFDCLRHKPAFVPYDL